MYRLYEHELQKFSYLLKTSFAVPAQSVKCLGFTSTSGPSSPSRLFSTSSVTTTVDPTEPAILPPSYSS